MSTTIHIMPQFPKTHHSFGGTTFTIPAFIP